jgi:hypothetical protein
LRRLLGVLLAGASNAELVSKAARLVGAGGRGMVLGTHKKLENCATLHEKAAPETRKPPWIKAACCERAASEFNVMSPLCMSPMACLLGVRRPS